MAINDISLTAGMRANLTSLQSTVTLLNRTQQRLSSGKAVNSALDNPVNFFAAQSLNARATDLAGYKDGMSNAVQTIQAADKGITGLTSLLGAAKAIASSVEGLSANTAFTGVSLNIEGITSGQTIVVGGKTLTAAAATANTSTTAATFAVGVGISSAQVAANIAAAYGTMSAGTTTVTATGVSGSTVTFADSAADLDDLDVTGTAKTGGTIEATTTAASSERGSLIAQYNEIMDQISSMAADSSFQGVNLLNATTMTVQFGGGSSLTVTGTATTYTALNLAKITTEWDAGTTTGATQMTAVDDALTALRSKSKDLSNNLAIINARQDFSTNLTNVLQTGADNLTLADSNAEGANMLMLQTRQSLGTTALSLSSQAAQSVLRLFS
jgi:flagellin